MAFPNTAKFPGAIATEADLLNAKDKVPSESAPTLSAGITAGASSFTVNTGEGARLAADNLPVTINDEIIFVGSRSGDTCSSLTRGAYGTTAAAHSSGDQVNQLRVAEQHNQLAVEVNALETELGVDFANFRLDVYVHPVERGGNAFGPGSANQIRVIGFTLPVRVVFGNITVYVNTADADASLYDVGIYDSAGSLVARMGARSFASSGIVRQAISGGGSVTMKPGKYYLAVTGDDSVMRISAGNGATHTTFASNIIVAETSSGGALPSSITAPSDSWVSGFGANIALD